MERRTFLRLGLGGAALVAAPPMFRRDPGWAQPAPGPFGHGIAAGDPLADRVILWTRVTPSADATPGSGLGAPTEVGWEVAADEGFTQVVARGTTTTDPARDHTVKVDAAGLQPLTTYLYRFTALGVTSPVGRARTAPAVGAAVDQLRFGVVSCSNWEGGYFSAYRHVAERDDLDWVLHLGDYVYEYGVGGYGPGSTFGRVHDPAHEMVSLEDYRRRHALYKTDPDLQHLHARYTVIATIDDHEVTDNSWADGAVNHQPATEGDYHARRAAAFRAYFEWMPIRVTGPAEEPERVWRRLAFGNLADLFMLDERTYRSQQLEGLAGDLFLIDGERDAPGRTMLGDEQKSFLVGGLRQSEATWKLLGNGVMFAPLALVDLPDVLGDLLLSLQLPAGVPVALNSDQWDGYRFEQRALTDVFAEVGGVVVLTGDIHSSWATEIPVDPGLYLPAVGGGSAGVEFVTPAVTSDSFSAAIAGLGLPSPDQIVQLLPLALRTSAPWFQYLEATRHGFGVFEVTPGHVQYDWHFISDRTDPNAGEAFATAYRSGVGTNRLTVAPQLFGRTVPGPALPGGTTTTAAAAGDTGTGTDGTGGTDRTRSLGTLPTTGVGSAVPTAIAAGAAALAVAASAAGRRLREEHR
jgi:alkaline phosphatase D